MVIIPYNTSEHLFCPTFNFNFLKSIKNKTKTKFIFNVVAVQSNDEKQSYDNASQPCGHFRNWTIFLFC